MNKKIISIACFFGMTAIILGAFGAHALKKVLTLNELNTFETGVKYQMYHALFLLFLSQVDYFSDKFKKTVLILVCIGVVLFSGSIYLLATNNLILFDFKKIGFLTPIGGLFFIVAWMLIFVKSIKKRT